MQMHEAQDLTQSFFAFVLEKNVIEAADPERGRFRSFLFGLREEFSRQRGMHKAHAQKRGRW